MRFFQFEQHMADTAHKKRLQKLEAFSKQTFSFHFQTFFSNSFFNILDLILQIASISSVRCFSHRNSSPKPMGTKINILGYLEAVSHAGEKARATRVSMLENLRRAFSLFSFFRALGLRRWK